MMKRLFFLFMLPLLLLAEGHSQSAQDPVAEKYARTITADDLSTYLHVLASDSLEGRETGEPGQKKAASYMAAKFNEFGTTPGMILNNGTRSYFQEFELLKKQWEEVYLTVNGKKKTFLEDFYAYGDLNFPKELKIQVVFAGYGIESSTYSDYLQPSYECKKERTPLNVKNKTVIILSGEPVVDGKSLVTGDSSLSSWANDWRKKMALAKSKGARAVLIVTGNSQEQFEKRLSQLKEHLSKPSLSFTYKERPGAFFISINLAAEILGVTAQDLITHNSHRSRFIPRNAADHKQNSYLANPNPVKLTPSSIALKCSVKSSILSTENVLAFIEGTDKKEEVVILTAHYDHLGREGGYICYGADDDGSGTVALMEIAQAFAQAKKEGHGPRRSVLIMPVTAEEKGLMGSEYYSDHPVYPLGNTIANLNIDMIGRIDEEHKGDSNYVYLIGSNFLSTELHDVSEKANKTCVGLGLDYRFNSFNDPNRFYYRSDHYNFAKHNIPVIFYFNGVHEDYHKPTDTVDKIIFPKAEKITRLIFYTAWELANMEKRIEVNVKGE